MIDLTDSFPEGVKIFKKDNFRRKPVPENYRCRVKGMLVVPCSSMLDFLKILFKCTIENCLLLPLTILNTEKASLL